MSTRRRVNYSPEKARIAWIKNKYSKPENAETRRLMAAYGITTKVKDFMSSKANGKCEICLESTKLVIDHDHDTGLIRGVLCSKCNRGLGHFNDDIDLLTKALTYVTIKTDQNNTEFS